MECLCGFASSVSRDLVCGVLNQLRYPCCFKNFVKKLEEEESNLIITRDSVQKFVTHVKKQARKPDAIVNKWLEDAINDVQNVNQLLEEARTQKHCCYGHCPNWIWRYHVGKKLANKTMHLEKVIEEGRKYVPFDRIATLPSNTLDMLLEKCMNFESRQSAYEQLLDAVKNNDVSMIGLYGMGGCGKTTLAMEVMKLVEAEHLFEKVLFVPVSRTVEVRRIQEKIKSSLQHEIPETDEMQRAQRLCSILTEEKSVLLILDDVWEKLDFGSIGIPSSEHRKGCKILITTRLKTVCTLMDCEKIYLPILTDDEAWTLFQNKALISEGTPVTLKDLGRQISNECKGLPVAIAAVACSLKGKAETVWSVALNKLRHSKPINIERGLTDPYDCLQLSYDNLDDKEAKSLFLLCSVFPEDSEINVEVLTRCAIGLGVVGEVDSYEEARSEVIAAKIKLVSCCLLLDANDECVKMHDIVRNVAHIIAKKENKMIKCEVKKDVRVEQNSLRYLWCVKFPNDLDCSNLEFLWLETKMKEFDGIFKRMGMLKVLILVNNEDGKTPLSTSSFKTLTNLRDLFITNCELSDFSFLSRMKNLQSLSLFGCSMPSFPKLQTDVAITLKLLELKKCDIKVKNFEVMKRIPLLEELYIIDIQGEWWDVNSKDNIEFFNRFSVPQTLQRYGIVLGSHKFGHFYHYNDEGIYIDGRTLLLNHFDISNEVIKGWAKKAKHLFVGNIHGGVKNIIPDIFQIEGGGLDELNKLVIRDSQELECLIDTRRHSSEAVTLFSKLHKLIIDDMKNLRVIWNCFLLANGSFENLEKLILSDCPRLTFLFTYVVARNLVQLKILKISRCDELKHIITYDEKSQDEFITGHPIQIIEKDVEDKNLCNILSPQQCFPKLEALHVDDCQKLKRLFSASASNDLPNLHLLVINGANELEELVGCKQGKTKVELPRLKLLIFMQLPNFSQEIEFHNLKNCIVYKCPKLSLTSTTTLEKLRADFPYKDFINTELHSSEFARLIYEDKLSEKYMNFESRKSADEQLLDAVKNNDISMIGLYGMGGCGKTTLAMEVKKLVEAEHLFEKVLFVPVSNTVGIWRIQENIASSLQFEFPETQEMQRAKRLCSRLIQEKNIFIILDDVWEKLDFGRIGIPSSEYHKSCKILITSRSEDVCTLMDCQRKIYLPILTDEEAWTLFQNKALITEARSDTLKEMGRLISNECKGLPVAIVAVACSLQGKDETVWRVALNKLKHFEPINIERGLINPYKCLQLSYDNLDTKEAKSLFLLCSVFLPEDSGILVEALTRCAIGLGVVGETLSYEEARSEVIAAKIKLVSCCLLLDVDDKHVNMHDIVRDVAHIIAKNENKMIKCEVEKDVTVEQSSVRYLWCAKFSNYLDCSNLEFLFLQTKMKEFDGIFKTMRLLKVLILVNDEHEKTPLSTISFKTLTNLQYLHITNCELSDFSFLSWTKNLQSLSLNHCLLPSFPELQTDDAITLKLLELNECDIKVKNFEVMKRIPLLEELYIIHIEGEWDANSEDNIEFFKTFSVPETLQRYVIVLRSYNFEDFDDGDIYIDDRTLLLNHFDISNEAIKCLAKKAKDLFVGNIHGGAKNMIPDIFKIEGGGLNELKKLEVRDSEELECLIDTSSRSSEVVTLFSKLHTLIIYNMKNLRVIWHCFVPSNGPFENLEKLYLSDCPRLTSLFTYVVARSLVKLKILKISRCNELKHILADDEKTEKGQDEFTSGHPVLIFHNLQEVEVYSCRELKHIFSTNIVGGLTQLKVLVIEDCDMLEQIIGDIVPLTEQDRKEELDEIVEEGNLSSLASLKIKHCWKLGSIFTASIAKTLTSLEEMFIEDCKSLKDIVTHESIVEDDNDCQSDISVFQSLKELHISECDLLEGIFPISFVEELNGITNKQVADLKDFCGRNMKFIFPNLKELSVYNCLQLKYMFGQYDVANKDYKEIHIQFSALELLSLRNLPKFVSICSTNNLIVTWPSLKDLELYKLPQMSYIWVGPNNSLTLQHLTTLYISECEKLEVIFPKSIVRLLPELKKVTIIECMELQQIIEEDESNLLSIDGGSEVEEIIGYDKEASKNYFSFPNLEKLEIIECAKLEIIFPKSVLRCSPKLKLLKIKKCKQLRQIIEGDKNLSNLVSPQPCFPKLEALLVDHCPKLKRCVSESASNELPNLHLLAINGAYELEELVGCKQRKIKVELPRLKLLIFMHLENFSQEIEFHNLKNCIVYKCPKLSLTSTTTLEKLRQDFPYKDFINTELESWEFQRIVRISTITDNSEFTSSQESEDVGNQSIKSSSTVVEDIGIGGVVSTHVESGGEDKLALDSKVVEQDDKLNEGKAGTVESQEGIDVFPNNNIDISSASADIRTRLGAYKHFVDLDDVHISLLVDAITTYPHLWNASKKFSERFQAWRLKILADMLLFLQKESDDSVIPEREKEFHKLCEEAIEIGFESSWIEEMRQRVVARDPKLGEEIARRQIDENSKSLLNRCSSGDVVEEGDGPKISLEEGSDLVDKEGEIGVVSNDHILAPRNEEAEQEFVAEVSTSEIPRIATSLTNSQTVEKPTPSHLNIPVRETPLNALVDTQQTSEPCLMKQKKPLDEIPKGIEQVAIEETIAKNTNMAASSILSESASSQLDSTVTFQSKSHSHPYLVYQESNSEGAFPEQHALDETIEIGDVRNDSIKEGSAAEGAKTKSLSTGVEDIGIGGAVATHIESAGVDILAQYSKVVEQDDKMNEGKAGIVPSREIQVEEGLILLDKQEGISIVSNNNIGISPDIPQREKEFHKLCKEVVEIGIESSWVDEMRQCVVMRDPKLREDIAQRQIEKNSKSLLNRYSSGDMVPDSQAVERGDGSKISLEEGSNLVDKEGEIGVASNDHIVTLRNEELEMEFVAKVSTSEIPRITTSLANSQPVERLTPGCMNMPLRETPANAFVDKQGTSEQSLMNQQKPFGEIVSSLEIPLKIEQVLAEETIAKNTNMAPSSILSEPVSSRLDQKITFQNKSHPHNEITSSQTEVGTGKEIDHPKIFQGFGTNNVISLFASEKESEDSPVGKTLAELEKFMKMSLKDVVSSETDTLRLWSTLNLLSNLPFKDVTLSDGLKRIIKTMHQHFPTILRSFKQGFATTDKLGKLEAYQNEVATTLVSKISETENFYNEAEQKEVVLKEQIKVCEAALSSLEKEKNKCIAETIGYKKELENVMKDRSQMVEDKRKVEQELFDVAYKWSVLCSEYELNRMAATNIP